MLKDSRTSNYNYLSFYAPLLWQYFRLSLGLMTVTAFLTYVLGLLHRHWTPTSVLASIHYILSGVLLYGYYTPLYVLSLLHGHCTLSVVYCMHTTHHLCVNTWTLHITGSLCSALKSPELEVHTEPWRNVTWSLSLSQDKACSIFSFWENARRTENWPVSSREAFINPPLKLAAHVIIFKTQELTLVSVLRF